jgi:hypothetical protein
LAFSSSDFFSSSGVLSAAASVVAPTPSAVLMFVTVILQENNHNYAYARGGHFSTCHCQDSGTLGIWSSKKTPIPTGPRTSNVATK